MDNNSKHSYTGDRDTISPGIDQMNSKMVYCDSIRQEVETDGVVMIFSSGGGSSTF